MTAGGLAIDQQLGKSVFAPLTLGLMQIQPVPPWLRKRQRQRFTLLRGATPRAKWTGHRELRLLVCAGHMFRGVAAGAQGCQGGGNQ